MRQALLIFLGCYYQIACTSNEDLEESFIFYEPKAQERFITRLSEEQIPYRVSKDGQVWYLFSNKLQVQSIQQEVLKEYSPGNAVSFPQEWQYEAAIRQFKNKGINYRLIESREGRKIVWEDKDDEEARVVLKNVADQHKKLILEKYLQ
jgi:hypothetical protein